MVDDKPVFKGPHTARHTCASELLRGGAYITAVSKRLGHSTPTQTLNIYSSIIPQDDEKLAAITSALFD
jgi:integrase